MTEIGSNPLVSPAPKRDSFGEDFRRFFVRGLAALLPTLITLLLLIKVWEILWDYLGKHLILVVSQFVPTNNDWWYVGSDHPGEYPWQVHMIGVALAILLVYLVGLVVGNFIGRTAWHLIEAILMRVPLIRAIYPAVKQVTDFVLAERKVPLQGSRVVAVQPHESGIWSIGLVTGPGVRPLERAVGTEMVTVFIPSSPTAFSGYVVMVPRAKVVDLPLSVEEAMRLLVTAGVSMPAGSRQPAALAEPLPGRPAVDRLPPG